VLRELGITSNHWVHFGRVLGAVLLETLELCRQDIKDLGNWEQDVQGTRYSSKLPMTAIRCMAGFQEANGMHFNTRTVTYPEDCDRDILEKQIFPFADACLQAVHDATARDGIDRFTAIHFLKLLISFRSIILQDAAVIAEFHPDRFHHPIFRMPIFQTPEFAAFQQRMRRAIESSEVPQDAQLDAVIPGMNARIANVQNSVNQTKQELGEKMDHGFEKLSQQISENNISTREDLSRAFMEAGWNIRNRGSQATTGQIETSSSNESGAQTTQNHSVAVTTTLTNSSMSSSFPGVGHKPKSHHVSVEQMYNEWYGVGEFEGIPIQGGIEAMEQKYKNRWRATMSSAESQRFSRVKRVVKAIAEIVSKEMKELSAVLHEFQTKYESCDKRLGPFVDKLAESGLRQKKKRRGTQQNESAAI
jgi:hypothetical protein